MKVRFKKTIKVIALIFLFVILVIFSYLFIGKSPKPQEIIWGVNFSQKHAKDLGLDWREVYLAILGDLGAKKIKLASYWDLIEDREGEYDFRDLDWQIKEAEKNKAEIILVMGLKTPSWPECHIPLWAKDLPRGKQQKKILDLLDKIVLRYKESPVVSIWQIENEPLFPFGECPWIDKEFLKAEIAKVKSLDGGRPVMITDSGEFSFWWQAARHGDIVGVTMYKKVWFKEFGRYFTYPFSPVFYYRKAQLVNKIFNKEVVDVELQAEPWGPEIISKISLEEQFKTMNLNQFQKNVVFAKESGLAEHYFWGVEWWYWMKEKQNMPEIWQEAKKLF